MTTYTYYNYDSKGNMIEVNHSKGKNNSRSMWDYTITIKYNEYNLPTEKVKIKTTDGKLEYSLIYKYDYYN